MRNWSGFLIIFFLLFTYTANAQVFQWAKRAGWYAFDLGYGIGTDNAGNVYVAGKYEMNAVFDSIIVNNEGNHDIFLAKYGPAGDLKWVRTAGGIIGDYARGLACDGDGNVYITGEIEETVIFGPFTLISHGNNDVFIAKYDTNGDLLWAKRVGGGEGRDRTEGISILNGNIFITGIFEGTAYFEGNNTLTSAGYFDIFIAKYTSEGIFQWIKAAGGPGDDEGYAICNDQTGNIYVTGYFSDTANFNGTYIASDGGTEIFIAKYNSGGDLLWVKKAGGAGNDYGMGIKVDNNDRIFLTGGFKMLAVFDSISLSGTGNSSDIFIARYTSSGNVVWVKKAGGIKDDFGKAITLDSRSNCYITGNYAYAATFGTTTITGVDSAEIYIAAYGVNGNFKWILKTDGVIDDSDPSPHNFLIETGLGICTDPAGNVLVTGAYRSTSTFGPTTLAGWDLHTEIFLTKIDLSPQIIPSKMATFCKGSDVILKTIEEPEYKYSWMKDGIVIKDATDFTYKASSAGNYSVIIITENDTITTEPTVVSESNSIEVSIAPSDPIFCQDSSTVLITSKSDDYEYEWKRNGITLPEGNQNFYKTDTSGDYQVKVIKGSCFAWSGITNVSLQTCPIPDTINNTELNNNFISSDHSNEDSLLVKIYPNPNSGLFTLEIRMVNSEDHQNQAKIEVINAIGQVVYDKLTSFDNGFINEHIELENSIPAGLYFLQVSIGEKVEKSQMMLAK